LPSSVTVSANSSTATFSAKAAYLWRKQSVTVAATYNGTSAKIALTVTGY
jgi:hypothetical protein